VAYRSLEQTIGEKYIILSDMSQQQEDYDFISKASTPNNGLPYGEGHGKVFKLTSIDDKNGHFVDSAGVEYLVRLENRYQFYSIASFSDFNDAVKLFLGKNLWMNADKLYGGRTLIDEKKYGIKSDITGVRFAQVTVIDILPFGIDDLPLVFVLKTAKGEVGYTFVNVSGTNALRKNENLFENIFFAQNPKTLYHFTAAVWKMIETRDVKIGMPAQAVELVMGRPDARHNTKTATTFREQWVYGTTNPSYYYFENGKLTVIQN
jgi:hypothetical protein